MALSADVHYNGQDINFLSALAITTAVTAVVTVPVNLVSKMLSGMKSLAVQALFTYGSGGTTVDVYVQSSMDQAATWFDVMNFHFTTATAKVGMAVNAYVQTATVATSIVTIAVQPALTDGTIAANSSLQGFLGSQLRLKYTTTGTYAGGTVLSVSAVAKG